MPSPRQPVPERLFQIGAVLVGIWFIVAGIVQPRPGYVVVGLLCVAFALWAARRRAQ